MAETVSVQLKSPKAYKILQDLEDLGVIKILSKSDQPIQSLSEKYAGKLPADLATELQNFVTEGRR